MCSKYHVNDDQFEKDYNETLRKLKSVLRDSETIQKAVEEKLNKDELEQLMELMRDVMPKAIRNLGQTCQFLNKYGYNNNVDDIQKDFQSARKESEEE